MMDLEYTDNNHSIEVKTLMVEIAMLQEKIHQLNGKISSIQGRCKHIFFETSGMRKCQKCYFTESTYY